MGLDLLLGLYFSLGVDLSLGACERASMRACECRGCGRAGGAGGRAGVRAGVSSLTRPWLDFLLKKCATGFLRLSDSLSLSLSLSFMCVFTGGLLVSFMWLPSAAIRSKNQHSIDFPTLGPGLENLQTVQKQHSIDFSIFWGRSSAGDLLGEKRRQGTALAKQPTSDCTS